MWYLKVSSSLLIAVALICMIQNAISLTLDPKTINDQWSTLESSTDQIDLKKISKICKNSMNNFNEKLENTKAIVNKRLPEPNKTTEDIVNLVSDIKTQIKNSSADLVSVRKLVQKTALRFRDTFKSLVSFTELDNESINKELENIKKTTVDSKKPLVNRVIRSFGNRYDLIKLANKVLEISSDHEKLKNNYVEKKKVAKKEFNSLWNSLSNHSKTVNDNAIKALETFFEGIKSVKSVKKKVKTLGEGALNAINVGDDINKLKNAVELAKALKLKFEDEWNLDSGELTYSEEQKKATTKTADENDNDNEQDKSIENSSTNDIEPSLPTAEQETIDNEKINIIPSTQAEIEKPSKDDRSTSNKTIFSVEDTQLPTETKNKDETKIIPPPDLEKDDHRDNNVSDNIDSSITETSFNPDNTNNETLITPTKDSVNNNKDKILNKRTSREKTPILPWQKLKELDDPQVSQQSMKCESLLNNTIPDFDNIKKSAKTQIQVTKSYNNLQKIENDIIQQFYDKMVSTNTQLSDNLVNAAEDVCANVTPINKRYETKFKNDPNIKRIKYLLGKQYDPNEYILKILDDASHKNGIGGMKKTTYYKMLAVAYNLNHEKKEMEDAALYAMNKIYEGKLAATNLKRMFNKEKASKACYIRNILLEKENDAEKKNKDENKEKVKESISDDITAEPLKPDVNLDSVDEIQLSVVNDDNGPILNNDEETKTFNETNESTALNNQGDTENDKVSDEKENIENEDEEQENQENYNDSSIPQNKDNDNDTTTDTTSGGNNTVKRSPTKKVTHHRKHRNPNDPNDVSEEYDTIEEEDETNLNESDEIKSADTPEAQLTLIDDNENDAENIEHSENDNGDANEETDEGNDSDQPKAKGHRKRIDPKDGKEISEEYNTKEEEDDKNLNDTNESTTINNQGDTENDKVSDEKENIENEDEEQENQENYNDSSIPQNKDNDNDTTTDTTSGGNNTVKRSPTKTVTHHRKHRNPNDPNDVSEEYDTIEEEDETNLNESDEIKSADTPEAQTTVIGNNENDAENLEHSENNNGDANEETDEGNDSDQPKTKRRRKRIDSKDGKEISEEYDTIEEEDDNNLNELNKIKPEDIPEIESSVEEEEVKEDIPYNDKSIMNDNTNEESINDNVINKNLENITKETEELDENENLNSVEGAELNGVDNENIIQAEESMGEDSTSYETSYEEPKQRSLNNSNNNPSNNIPLQERNNIVNKHNKRNRPHRKRKDPKNGLEVSEEYDTIEEQDEEPLLGDNNTETPSETPDNTEIEESDMNAPNDADIPANKNRRRRKRKDPISGLENNNGDSPPETPDNTEIEEGSETPEFEESDMNAPNDADNQPQNNRRRRKRKDPITGLEVSEEYDSIEEQDEEPLLGDNNKETPSETPDNTEIEEDSETPEFEESDMNAPNDADIPANKNRRQRKRKVPISDLEINNGESPPETPDNTEIEEGSETPDFDEGNINAQNEVDNQPQNNRRRRKRKDPITGLEVSEEYDSIEEQDEEPLLGHNNTETPSETHDNTEIEEDSETPEFEESDMNAPNDADIPANKNRRRRKRKDPISGLENNNGESLAETPDNTEIEEGSETPDFDEGDINAQNEVDNQPQNNRRRRKRKDPITGLEVSEEYDSIEEQDKEPLLGHNNTETPSETPDNTEVEEDSETPEFEESDMNAPNDADIPANKNRRRRTRKNPISGLENNNRESPAETPDNTEIEEDSETPDFDEGDINAQNEVDNQPQNNRRRRKRKDPITGLEVSEEYDSIEEQDEEPLLGDNNKETPSETPDNTEIEEDSETPEFEESDMNAPNDADIPANKNRRRRKRKDPISGLENNNGESPAETPDNTEIEEGSETPDFDEGNINAQNEVDNQPQNNRRRRKRKDPITGLEVSEEYDSIEEQDEEPLLGHNNTETPSETHDNTEIEEDSETPEFEESDMNAPNDADIPANKNRRRRKRKDPISGLENNNGESLAETPDNTEIEEGSETPDFDEGDINAQNEVDNQPQNNRRRRKRKDPITGLEVSEEYDSIEEQDEEPLLGHNNTETPSETPDNTEVEEDSETPEFEESDMNAPNDADIPANKNRRRRTRKNPISGLENNNRESPAETPDNTEIEEDSETPDFDEGDINAQNEVDNQPQNNRRRRKRKDPITGLEVSEEYDSIEEQDKEPLLGHNNTETPSETPDNTEVEEDSETPEFEESDMNAPNDADIPANKNRRQRKRKDPISGLENNNRESPAETPDNTEIEEGSETPDFDEGDINAQNEVDNQPQNNRRRRKRKDPITGLEVSEEYDSIEEQDEEPLLGHNNTETPSETPDNTEVEEDSETPEFEESDMNAPNDADIPANKNRRRRTRKNPISGLENNNRESPAETPDNTEIEEDSETPDFDEGDINAQNEVDNQPQNNRRRRKRKDPITGLEVSEEYDSIEEQDKEPLLGHNNTETPSETPDNTEVEEDSETPEFEESDMNAPNDADIPANKNRRQRKRKDPISGLENNNRESPAETPDNTEIEEGSETPDFDEGDINAQNEVDNQPQNNRRRRKRKDPITGLEVSEEYDSIEEQDEEPLLGHNNTETPSETPDNTEVEEDSETPEFEESDMNAPNDADIPANKNRRRRKRKNPISDLENNNGESPAEKPDNLEIEDDSEITEFDLGDINSQNGSGNPSQKNRRHRKRKDPITGFEVSEEYDTIEEHDEEPLMGDNNRETQTDTPDNTEIDEFSETPEFDKAPYDTNEYGNVEEPSPRKFRGRRKSRQPQFVKENSNEPLSVLDNNTNNYPFYDQDNESIPYNNNDVDDEVPDTGYGETNDIENNKEEPELVEYPDNSYVPSKDYVSPNYMNENGNVAQPSPRKLRRRKNSRQPQVVNENSNEPLSVIDNNTNNYPFDNQDNESIPYNNNDVDEEVPDTGYGETNDIENNKEEPELVEYPDNSYVPSKDYVSPNYMDENGNVAQPSPRKLRRRRKSRQPQVVNENSNEPLSVIDNNTNNYPFDNQDNESIPYNNNDVDDEVPDTGYGETNDIENNKEEPELVEYPDNSYVPSKDYVSPNYMNENGNVAQPSPRKLRRRRKSRQPQVVNENSNEPLSVIDNNTNNYPFDNQDNESIPYNNNDVDDEVPDTGYGETNDIENNKEEPELVEYPDNSYVPSKDYVSPNYINENGNVAQPSPRKLRRRKNSRQPQVVNENSNEPLSVIDNNTNNYPFDNQDNESIPYNNNDVDEDVPDTGYGETNDIENNKEEPELVEYPDNSYVPSKDYVSPNYMNENGNVAQPSPRKLRRRKNSRQPQVVNENSNEPLSVIDNNTNNYPFDNQDNESIPYNNNDVDDEVPDTGYGETNDIENNKEEPELVEYPDNSYVPSKDYVSPNYMDENGNVAQPSPRKLRRRRKSRQPQVVNENSNEPLSVLDNYTNNYPVDNQDVNNESVPKNESDVQDDVSIPYKTVVDSPDGIADSTSNSKKPKRKKHSGRKTIPTSVDTENSSTPNNEKSTENPEIQPKDIRRNPKKKRHIRRIRTYVVNKETNERIPINDETYSTTNGLPDALHDKLDSLEDSRFDDLDSNTDNDDYSSFLFKEYNSDQCKRNAYDRFKKVASQDAKQIAYRSVLDTSEMRSNMLATVKNAIGNVKASRTLNDVDQSLRTVSYSLKAGLKQTISDLVIKVVPLAKDFLKTTENLKELYQKGPQSTHKMLTNILENESIVPDSAKDILTLISPQFDVDELINNIFEKPCFAKSLKEKKIKAQRKLINLSKYMDTAISNIDCFVLSAMSTVGIGADTLKLLKSGRVIMSDKHPRAKILKDAVGIIKSGKNIRNNIVDFTPTLTTSDGNTESDEDDDDEDPEQVAQKNEEFLKTVPDLDDNIPVPKKFPNKRKSLGVIVVHPNKQIEYKEVNDTSQLKKFVGDQKNKYKLQSKNKHPKFLKLNSKKVIDAMVADVKKKAERNGMTKKEMIEEIIRTLNNS